MEKKDSIKKNSNNKCQQHKSSPTSLSKSVSKSAHPKAIKISNTHNECICAEGKWCIFCLGDYEDFL